MSSSDLCYRGVRYDASHHEQPPVEPVEHVYRGIHYSESLRHEPSNLNEDVELHYRGLIYQHRRKEAARQVRQA